MTIESAIARLRDFAREQGWTKTRLARAAGLPDTTLRAFHEATWNPTVDTLRKLEALIPEGWTPSPATPPVPAAAPADEAAA